jgi:phosphopantetheinyl transferase (holo-ACP synthase)
MTNQVRFTINSLLEERSALVQITPVASGGVLPGGTMAGLPGSRGLGLEIEDIAALPDAEDYARNEFYLARFTPSEIAYCGKQFNTKATYQGLLVAKRAIIKSGAANNQADALRGIEIGFDADGRPIYPGCLLSITHTGTIAVAICFWLSALPRPAAPVSGATPVHSHTGKFALKTIILAGCLG